MKVLPHYFCPEPLKKYVDMNNDHIIAIQLVDPSFNKQFNDQVFTLIANGRIVRNQFVEGSEIGDPINNRYYLQIC